jgi:GNAT superfamily N-acetyltransferase
MTMDLWPLQEARVDEALGWMRRFYAEEGLEYREERARAPLLELIGHPEFGRWWFLEADGRTVGYVVMTLSYSLEFGGRFALLDELYVEQEWRGRGIGRRALKGMIAVAEQMRVAAVRLEVDRAKAHVRALYERIGFVAHDRDLMTKWL